MIPPGAKGLVTRTPDPLASPDPPGFDARRGVDPGSAAQGDEKLETWLVGIPIPVWIGAALALYMAWSIGANDVANAMGTSVGSGALSIRNAIIVAAILEFCGAVLAGGSVTDTVRKGLLDLEIVSSHPDLLVYGMLAALASAGTLLIAATKYGLPVSTTHSIVGAIVGFGAVGLGVDAVNWGQVFEIVASWVTSPLIGGFLGFMIFSLIRATILDTEDPVAAVRRTGPFYFFYVFFIIGLVTLFKGLKKLKLDLDLPESFAASLALGLVGAAIGVFFMRRVKVVTDGDERGDAFHNVERLFVVLQVLTACAVAFAHGSNDVANSIGPLAAVVQTATHGTVGGTAAVHPWMLAIGGVGIVVGLATWGYRVMETVGKKITELTPSRGFSAELAAATTIVLASKLGIPVSTTHILVGAVIGVGVARGIGALDLRVLGKIAVSWVSTLPISAVLAVVFYYFFKGLLS